MAKKIRIFLWFDKKAQDAANFYVSIFKRTGKAKMLGCDPMSSSFRLEDMEFIAFNGGRAGFDFEFSPATSLFVTCETQREVDHYWNKLSEGGKKRQCGWLTDKFGVTWQIVPSILHDLIADDDAEKAGRALKAMMKMKKLDIAALKKAHSGRR